MSIHASYNMNSLGALGGQRQHCANRTRPCGTEEVQSYRDAGKLATSVAFCRDSVKCALPSQKLSLNLKEHRKRPCESLFTRISNRESTVSRLTTKEAYVRESSDLCSDVHYTSTMEVSYDKFYTENRATFDTRPQDEEEQVDVQEMTVYEVNQLDRGSPALLSLSKFALDWYDRFRPQPLGGLGDMVTFSNKIFDGMLKKRLGITAGIISVIGNYPDQDALLFEAAYSFYFGDLGHICVKGAYRSDKDTDLAVKGGSGIFRGVYGTVHLHNVEYPRVLFYRFRLQGIPRLPRALQWDTIPPTRGLHPSLMASLPSFCLPNFTD
ncbi:hypothetical protein KP509_37G069700 [Ceratopteris richardii]|uniref:allene-oxide cyclase n=3 Tax=Ceratopteris richardii TaxID=49495 RepID=A0A8T2QAE2_CERRI|nr:hypothetical protein KP509_37G069700 [Ceratopteris richardii]